MTPERMHKNNSAGLKLMCRSTVCITNMVYLLCVCNGSTVVHQCHRVITRPSRIACVSREKVILVVITRGHGDPEAKNLAVYFDSKT